MIGKIKCLFGGHKRGTFHSNVMAQGSEKVIARMFICQRCKATWTRKVKA